VRQVRTLSPFAGIGRALHAHYNDIAKQPLPERWVDLINYLNNKEQARRRAQHWSDRAEEARLQAADMADPETRREMLKIAAEYRRLAQHAEDSSRTGGPY
jgi:hypothetical protein